MRRLIVVAVVLSMAALTLSACSSSTSPPANKIVMRHVCPKGYGFCADFPTTGGNVTATTFNNPPDAPVTSFSTLYTQGVVAVDRYTVSVQLNTLPNGPLTVQDDLCIPGTAPKIPTQMVQIGGRAGIVSTCGYLNSTHTCQIYGVLDGGNTYHVEVCGVTSKPPFLRSFINSVHFTTESSSRQPPVQNVGAAGTSTYTIEIAAPK